MEKDRAKHRLVPRRVNMGSLKPGPKPRTQSRSTRKQHTPEARTMAEKRKTSHRHRLMRSPCSGATRHRMRPPMTTRQTPKTLAKKGDRPISKSAESTISEMKAPKAMPTTDDMA